MFRTILILLRNITIFKYFRLVYFKSIFLLDFVMKKYIPVTDTLVAPHQNAAVYRTKSTIYSIRHLRATIYHFSDCTYTLMKSTSSEDS